MMIFFGLSFFIASLTNSLQKEPVPPVTNIDFFECILSLGCEFNQSSRFQRKEQLNERAKPKVETLNIEV